MRKSWVFQKVTNFGGNKLFANFLFFHRWTLKSPKRTLKYLPNRITSEKGKTTNSRGHGTNPSLMGPCLSLKPCPLLLPLRPLRPPLLPHHALVDNLRFAKITNSAKRRRASSGSAALTTLAWRSSAKLNRRPARSVHLGVDRGIRIGAQPSPIAWCSEAFSRRKRTSVCCLPTRSRRASSPRRAPHRPRRRPRLRLRRQISIRGSESQLKIATKSNTSSVTMILTKRESSTSNSACETYVSQFASSTSREMTWTPSGKHFPESTINAEDTRQRRRRHSDDGTGTQGSNTPETIDRTECSHLHDKKSGQTTSLCGCRMESCDSIDSIPMGPSNAKEGSQLLWRNNRTSHVRFHRVS